MKEKMKHFINEERKKYIYFYKIMEDGQISLKEKQKLIDAEVNKMLINEKEIVYTITPKVELLCQVITQRIKYFSSNDILLIKNKEIKQTIYQLCNNNQNISLILLSIIGKIFTSLNKETISITNFAVLLAKHLIGSLISIEKEEDASKFTTQTLLKIGMIFFGILETNFLFKDNNFKLFNKHKELFLTLSEDAIDILCIIPQFGNHHPLLVNPSNYSAKNQVIKDRIFKFNMYHINCECGLRKEHTIIDEAVISTLNYLQSQPFVINRDSLNHVIENPSLYLEEFDEYKDIFIPLKYENIDLYLKELNEIDKQKAKKKYYKGKVLLDLFIKTIIFAELYKDEKIYFNTYLDWRGRIYYNGYPLNPQSYKLCRRLLKLENANIMCSFDVTASGFQIIGLLKCDLFLLQMTNFKNKIDKDIYEYIMDKYKEYINKELNHDEYPFLLSSEFNKKIFNRKFIKNLAMCLIYTEGNFSRANKIEEMLANTSLNISKKDLMKLASLFKSCVYKSIPSVSDISKNFSLLLKNISQNKLIYLKSSNNHISTVLSYPKQKIKRIRITKYPISLVGKTNPIIEKKNLYVNIVPYKNNISKIKRALFPNFIHQVDSLILHKVIQKAKEKKISLYTIHDCFVSDIKNKEILNEIYKEACIDVVIIDKPLQTLFFKNTNNLQTLVTENIDDLLIKEKNNINILKEEIYDIITN